MGKHCAIMYPRQHCILAATEMGVLNSFDMTPLLSFYKGLKDHRISPCCVLGIIHEESSIISMYVYYVPDPLLKKMGICCEQGSAQQRFFCLGFMVMKPFFSDTCHCVEERTDLTMGLLIYTHRRPEGQSMGFPLPILLVEGS